MSRRTPRPARRGPRTPTPRRSRTPEAMLDATATSIVASIRRDAAAWAGKPDPLGALLGRGIEMFDTYVEPPVTDEVPRIMPLLRARLRLLPPPRAIEPREIPDDEREALVADFAAAHEARGLKRVAGTPASRLARWFVDFACDYGAGDPVRWSPIAVEILLADWLPRKAILLDRYHDVAIYG